MVMIRDGEEGNIAQRNAKFSVVIHNPRKEYLVVPAKFAAQFLKPIPKHGVLKTVDGENWEVSLYKFEGVVAIGYGWCEFKSAYGITTNYILHFKYDFDSAFVVTIFDYDSVEIRNKVIQNAVLAMVPYDPLPDRIMFVGMIPAKCCGRCGSKLPVKKKNGKRKRNTGMLYSILFDPVYGDYSPFFTTILAGSNVRCPFIMELDKDFARTQLPKSFCIKYLRVGLGKDVWPVLCTFYDGEGLITHGWEKFVIDNKVADYGMITIERSVKDGNIWNVWLKN